VFARRSGVKCWPRVPPQPHTSPCGDGDRTNSHESPRCQGRVAVSLDRPSRGLQQTRRLRLRRLRFRRDYRKVTRASSSAFDYWRVVESCRWQRLKPSSRAIATTTTCMDLGHSRPDVERAFRDLIHTGVFTTNASAELARRLMAAISTFRPSDSLSTFRPTAPIRGAVTCWRGRTPFACTPRRSARALPAVFAALIPCRERRRRATRGPPAKRDHGGLLRHRTASRLRGRLSAADASFWGQVGKTAKRHVKLAGRPTHLAIACRSRIVCGDWNAARCAGCVATSYQWAQRSLARVSDFFPSLDGRRKRH
jgi:hypothetical protein